MNLKNHTFVSKCKFQLSRVFFRFLKLRPYLLDDFHRNVYRFLIKRSVDLVIVEGGSGVYEYRKISKLLGKQKMVLHLHATFNAPKEADNIFGNYIAISEYVKNIWLYNSRNHCFVLKNAIDDKFFETVIDDKQKDSLRTRFCISDEDFLIVYCGRLIPVKGVKELCLAVRQKENVKLLIIGSTNFGMNITSDYEKEIQNIV